MKIGLLIKGKKKIIECEECKSFFSKARGLMFRKNPKPLIFNFKKPTKMVIHSFFCKPFIAVWLKKGKVIERKKVKPFSFSVRPREKYDCLVELPLMYSP